MGPLQSRKVREALKKKGFTENHTDHFRYDYWIGGKKTSISTKISHGPSGRDVPPRIVSIMARQCGLTTRDFRNLIGCPISRGEYRGIVKRNLQELGPDYLQQYRRLE